MIDEIKKELKKDKNPNNKLLLKQLKAKKLSKSALIEMYYLLNNVDGYKNLDDSSEIVEEKNLPLVSFVIPTYKRLDYLKKCLDSILKQTYPNIEIIVVDDCSGIDIGKFLKDNYSEYNNISFYVNKKNSGPGVSRKNGYKRINGKYVVFCDDDDFYINKNFVKKGISKLLANPDLSFVSFNAFTYYDDINKVTFKQLNISHYLSKKDFLKNFQIKYNKPKSTFTTIFDVEKLEKSDFKKMKMVNDSSIYMRALLSGNAFVFDRIIGCYRMHSNNISNNIKLDFLIENLEEKKYIYNVIKKEKLFSNSDMWMCNQIWVTSKYYILGSKPKFSDFFKLEKWILNTKIKGRYKLIIKNLRLKYFK